MTKLRGNAKQKARKKKRQQVQSNYKQYRADLLGKILKYDNDVLTAKCEEVAQGTDVSKTVATMKKVLGCTDNGVGLAASQIGILDRIIIIREDASKTKMTAMINPEIISHSEEKKYGIEGCLSYPKTFAPVERYATVEVKYFDENWKEQTLKSKVGTIQGIVIQHEIEHLSEGNCQLHDWWNDMEGKQAELQEIFDKKSKPEEETSSYEVVDSEDRQREKAEAESL